MENWKRLSQLEASSTITACVTVALLINDLCDYLPDVISKHLFLCYLWLSQAEREFRNVTVKR